MNLRKIFKPKIRLVIFVLLPLAGFFYFLHWRFLLSVNRYFDADEFAYLHWGDALSGGEKPYTDFFYFQPPFFLYPIVFIYKIFGRTVFAVIQARLFIFSVYCAVSFLLFFLVKKLGNLKIAALTLFIWIFLPLPMDKMIEVRPDLLGLFFALSGMYLYIFAKEKEDRRNYFLSGFCYGLSLGIIPKTIYFLFPVFILFGYDLYQASLNKNLLKEIKCRLSFFVLGFTVPSLVVLYFLYASGNTSLAFYSITKLSLDVSKILGQKFFIPPNMFFYPIDVYYGSSWYGASHTLNLMVYLVGSVWAVLKFISSLAHADKNKRVREFLTGGTFFFSFFAYVYLIPLRHAQYLIPLSVFVSYYFADFVFKVLAKWSSLGFRTKIFGIVLYLSLMIYIFSIHKWMMEKKINWTNNPSLEKIASILAVVPENEPIFDLTGETVFFKSGHYFCCLPYGQYAEVLYFDAPSLQKEARKRKTNYVYVGENNRITEIPAMEAKYIKDHYESISVDGSLLKLK